MLGDTFTEYRELVDLTPQFEHEWMYYGPKYGWKIKFVGKGKVLLYLTPGEGEFRVGFAVRDTEREALLKSKLPAPMREELKNAKRYPEGYPVRVAVKKKNDSAPVRTVVETLVAMRS